MKKIILHSLAIVLALNTFGQTNPTADEEKAMKSAGASTDTVGWKKGGTVGLNTSQTYLSNWAAGGQSSITFGGLLDVFANMKKGKNAWDNSLQLAHGILLQDVDSRAIKTDDKIDLTSKYGRQASNKWFYAGLFNFKTQLAPGYEIVGGLPNYNNKISNLLSPGFMLLSLGMDYKPSDKLSVFMSPLTYRMILVMDDDLARVGAFGVQKEELGTDGLVVTPFENIRTEFGGYGRVIFKTDVVKNVSYNTKLELFLNYLDQPQNVDVSWENLISMKVNEYISAFIATHMIYDDNTIINKGVKTVDQFGTPLSYDLGPGLQFKEVFGLNFSYKF